jgi:hypothetical protein
MNKLYHREVYWLDSFDSQSLTLIRSIERLSNHFYEHIESGNHRYDIKVRQLYFIIKEIDESNCRPFEVEVEDGKVVKCVIRLKYDDEKDISIVVREGFIVSAWLNNKCDNHLTLDRSKYEVSLDNVNK